MVRDVRSLITDSPICRCIGQLVVRSYLCAEAKTTSCHEAASSVARSGASSDGSMLHQIAKIGLQVTSNQLNENHGLRCPG